MNLFRSESDKTIEKEKIEVSPPFASMQAYDAPAPETVKTHQGKKVGKSVEKNLEGNLSDKSKAKDNLVQNEV